MSDLMDTLCGKARLAECAKHSMAYGIKPLPSSWIKASGVHIGDAANEPNTFRDEPEPTRRDPLLWDEYQTGLDDVPTARMERERPDLWEDESTNDQGEQS